MKSTIAKKLTVEAAQRTASGLDELHAKVDRLLELAEASHAEEAPEPGEPEDAETHPDDEDAPSGKPRRGRKAR